MTSKQILYTLFFLIGLISAAVGLNVGDSIQPSERNELLVPILIWMFLLFLSLLFKNPRAAGIVFPVGILVLILNNFLLSSPLNWFFVLFSPTALIFAIFPLMLSFAFRDESIRFALKATALSYTGLAIVMCLFFWYSAYVSFPDYVSELPETTVMRIDKLEYEPEIYSELTEGDLKEFPALKRVLEDMKKIGLKSFDYEVPREEGQAICDYLITKQDRPCCSPYVAQFKYKGEFYGFHLV